MKSKFRFFLFTGILLFVAGINLSAQSTKQVQNDEDAQVQMYYFHFNTRCETCRAVESEAQLGAQLLFGDDVKFTAVNLDDKEGEKIVKKLGVNSQMLLVVKEDKRINLTNEGFLYALTNPDKFRDIIEEKVKLLL